MGGALYAAGGGATGHGTLRSCERYDPAANAWTRIADLPEPRYCLALACLRGGLYAVGGLGADHQASSAPPWRYDAVADAWVEAPLAVDASARAITNFESWTQA